MLAPWDAMGSRTKKVRCASRKILDFIRDDFRGLRRQGQESEEIPAPRRVRSESSFEAAKGVFVLEQCDHDTFRRRMLALADPSVPASRCGPDCRGVTSEDSESIDLLAVPETEPGKSKEHGEDECTDSHRTCGDRQLYHGPESSCATCSAGRTSGETRRSARSADPIRSSSSNTPMETIRSLTTSARSVTSAGTRVSRTGMSPRPGGTTRPTNETRGG